MKRKRRRSRRQDAAQLCLDAPEYPDAIWRGLGQLMANAPVPDGRGKESLAPAYRTGERR